MRPSPLIPFFKARDDELSVFCFCLLLGQGIQESFFREMNWHAAALFLARIILRPLHPSIGARRIAS